LRESLKNVSFPQSTSFPMNQQPLIPLLLADEILLGVDPAGFKLLPIVVARFFTVLHQIHPIHLDIVTSFGPLATS